MRSKIVIMLSVLAALVLSGCSRIKDIKVTSCSVESVQMRGFRGLDARLLISVENPSMELTLEDIHGVLYRNGKEFVDYTADPVTLKARTAAVYPLDCSATLPGDVSVMELLSLASDYDIEEFTTDIHAKVRLRSGLSKQFTLKDLKLKDLLEGSEDGKSSARSRANMTV